MCRILYFIAMLGYICAQPDGWKMTDRFFGFRYELKGSGILDVGFEQSVLKEADEIGCFGWIQKNHYGNLVGEARCSKHRGPLFQEFLAKGPKGSTVTEFDAKIYPDTKIRLHFSTFKILPPNRDTCFLDSPHKCEEFEDSAGRSHGIEL
jgi:hypothetical protein